jgi:hypothetical protein
MTASRSDVSNLPCRETTLCPSADIRFAISSAVSRLCDREFINLVYIFWIGEANLDENDALPYREQVVELHQHFIFVCFISAIYLSLTSTFTYPAARQRRKRTHKELFDSI